MDVVTCTWSPENIVELVKALAWPVVILLASLRFESGVAESVRGFFSRNAVKEISAGSSGVKAIFEARRQIEETTESGASKVGSLPEGLSVEAIRAKHAELQTELTEEFYAVVKRHSDMLEIPDQEKIELLLQEISHLQTAIRIFELNKVLFRSQYDLLRKIGKSQDGLAEGDLDGHFAIAQANSNGGLVNWDRVKYLAYPVSVGLIKIDRGVSKLTPLARSYLSIMDRNPQLVVELSKL
jgi:hypothetical protein